MYTVIIELAAYLTLAVGHPQTKRGINRTTRGHASPQGLYTFGERRGTEHTQPLSNPNTKHIFHNSYGITACQ